MSLYIYYTPGGGGETTAALKDLVDDMRII